MQAASPDVAPSIRDAAGSVADKLQAKAKDQYVVLERSVRQPGLSHFDHLIV
jgi:hypothetical protein